MGSYVDAYMMARLHPARAASDAELGSMSLRAAMNVNQDDRTAMMRVGFVGWRGMVGSVLIQRMLEEKDFELIDPVFFSTSSAGGTGPRSASRRARSDAERPHGACAELDAIVTCQGGDWTKPMHARLRGAGWNGYWIDAASTLRMADDAVIILDPVNRDVIDAALGTRRQELHRRQLHGQPDDDGARGPAANATWSSG